MGAVRKKSTITVFYNKFTQFWRKNPKSFKFLTKDLCAIQTIGKQPEAIGRTMNLSQEV